MNDLLNAYNGLRGLDILILCGMGVLVAIIAFGRGKAFRRLILFIFLIGLIGIGYHYHRQVGRWFFPMPYQETIIENARAQNIDPAFVAAVIYVESGFNPKTVSPRGAVGLMQVMPDTGRWVAIQAGKDQPNAEELMSHETNIFIGTWYLRYLLDQVNQDPVLALAAYNAGWNRVKVWLQQRVWNGQLNELHQIPYSETRTYITRVLRIYHIYQYLYSNSSSQTSYPRLNVGRKATSP